MRKHRLRFSLFAQILTLLLLQLCLFPAANIFVYNSRISPGWQALFKSPLGERAELIARLIEKQTETHPESSWSRILDEFGGFYGAKFYLIDPHGQQLAGEPVHLPEEVRLVCAQPLEISATNGSSGDTALQTEPDTSKIGTNSVTDTHPPAAAPLMLPPFILATPPGIVSSSGRRLIRTTAPECFWIIVRTPIYIGQRREFVRGSVVMSSTNLWQSRIIFDLVPSLTLLATILGMASLFWTPFAIRITRNLSRMSKMTERIAEGRFETRLPVNNIDELGTLGESINKMADRLESFVMGEKRFLGDIAHELCSPIARLQLALELLEEPEDATEREKTIRKVRLEVEEMSSLINELLAFSKAGLRGKEIELVPVNLQTALRQVIEKACAEQLVTVNVEPAFVVLADEMLLQRAFGNIFRNGIRYAGAYGAIEVQATKVGTEIVIVVSDSGPGVPPELVNRLGEPFFRAESSRNRATGGTGLGLAIVKACIQACRGNFIVRNREPQGLEIEIRLEAAPD